MISPIPVIVLLCIINLFKKVRDYSAVVQNKCLKCQKEGGLIEGSKEGEGGIYREGGFRLRESVYNI